MAKQADTKAVAAGDATPTDTKAMAALIKRAEGGDERALAEVRKTMKAHPEMWDVYRVDLGATVRGLYGKLLAGKNGLVNDAIGRQAKAMQREVAGANPTKLEALLAERVAMCWLQLQSAEVSYASAIQGSISLAKAEYHQRHVERAQRMYLAAVRTLAQVRRLMVPSVQVNIGQKQVNIGGPQVNLPAGGGNAALPEGDVIEMPQGGQDGA